MNKEQLIEALEEVVRYYEATRQAGHTTAMICGVRNVRTNPVIITHSQKMSSYISNKMGFPVSDAEFTTTGQLKTKLQGRSGPLAWDNCALHMLFIDILKALKEGSEDRWTKERIKKFYKDFRIKNMNKLDTILCVLLCIFCLSAGIGIGSLIQKEILQKEAVALHYAHFVPDSESSNKFVWFSNTMWQVKE